MALVYKTPQEISQQYYLHLKTLKPEVNVDQTDSDWWIRGQVVGGLISGIYADQRKLAEDPFPQSARREALEKHLETYFGSGFNAAQQSQGSVRVSGATGSIMPLGTEFTYSPNGNTYQTTEALTLANPTGSVAVRSVASGQDQNLLDGAGLFLASPPAGFDSAAYAYGNISDGSDAESEDSAAARILARIRNPISGGTVTDYEQYAAEADPSVVDVNIMRYIFGLGTVGVVITAGTTDIDTALDNGDAIVRIPSDDLIDTVQAYVDTKKPLTDCAYVLKAVPVNLDVSVRVHFLEGDSATIPAGQSLTQAELVQREVKRAIYKTPPGGRRIGASGYVLASEIEELIDAGLSAPPYTEGSYAQIVSDRQVLDLSATGANRMISDREIAEPGVITIIEI